MMAELAWLKVQPTTLPAPAWAEQERLDGGEYAALLLGIELKADLILLDDLAARNWALRRSLPITGTVGILLRAKNSGLIALAGPLLDELRSKGIHIGDLLYSAALTAAGES
ncbi:MAG: DUF3368 domain-containing protein [Thermomicrobiales bacterium]